MLKESPMNRGTDPDLDAELVQLRNDLWGALDKVVPEGNPMDTWLGPLAGLLISKWAGYAESTREVAVGSRRASVFELPDALRLSAWDGPVANHAAAVTKALKGMTGRNMHRSAYSLFPIAAYNRWGSPVARHVAQVAPLMIRAAQNSPGMFEELFVWVHRLEFSTLQGRTLAAQLFDEVLWSAVGRNENLMGEFITPGPVADLMLELADPKLGERVYDPCFGFGELLVGTIHRLRGAAAADSPNDRSPVPSSGTFGFEIHPAAYGVGLCRVLLAGGDRPVLALGDTLERPLPSDRSKEGFDCIIAAPPWGNRSKSDSPSPVRFPFPSRKTEVLFLQHVMASLRPGGRAIVVYPYMDLADPDHEHHYPAGNQVRKYLLSNYRVDAVVSLPPDVFTPVTGIDPKHAKIMVFRRSAPRLFVSSVEISADAWRGVPDVVAEDRGRRECRYIECASVARSGAPVKLMTDVAKWVRRGPEGKAVELPIGVVVLPRPVRDLLLDDPHLSTMMEPTFHLYDFGLEEPSLRTEPMEHVAEVYTGGADEHGDAPERGLAPSAKSIRLQVGDIVVSITGDVGIIELMSATGPIGSKATKHMAVLRAREDVKPEYLSAILRSPNFRIQMESQAQRSTDQQLSLRSLRELRIPVPEMLVQDMVLWEIELAPEYKSTAELNKLLDYCGHDAEAILYRVLSGVERHLPLAVWTENPIVAALALERDIGILDPWNALIGCAKLLAELAPLLHKDRYYESDMQVWSGLDKAIEAASCLVQCAVVPMGAGRLAVLERARGMLGLAMEKIQDAVFRGPGEEVEDVTPYDRRLWWFLFVMDSFANREIQAMRESVQLDVAVEPVEVPLGTDSEVQLRMSNSSVVPLVELHVSTQPPVGQRTIPYLANGAHIDIPLTVHPEDSTQPFQISVSWRARHLDGMDVQGEAEKNLSVSSVRKPVPIGDLGTSPYIVGNPVERKDMFYGRTRIMERIKGQLGSEANVILLEGNRRTGKTSILKQLGKPGALPEWIPVYCSFQEAEGDDRSGGITTRNVFRLLARKTGWALYDAGVETWFPDLPDREPARRFQLAFRAALNQAFAGDHSFETFELYVETALQAARPKRVLLMLDEFDKLQEGIDARITSPQVPENIRHVLQHQRGLSAIITGSRRLKRLREEYWSALFGFGHRIGVSAMPTVDARRLVTKPVEGRLDYLPRARDRIVELCARHPFLIQSLCNRVFEHTASDGGRTITVDIVERAASDMVADNEHFRTLWDYAGTTRRQILLALCDRLAKGPDAVNLNLLRLKLQESRIPFRQISDLTDDIDELRELELIDLDERDRRPNYRLAVPLMAKWLRSNVDFESLLVRARQEGLKAQP